MSHSKEKNSFRDLIILRRPTRKTRFVLRNRLTNPLGRFPAKRSGFNSRPLLVSRNPRRRRRPQNQDTAGARPSARCRPARPRAALPPSACRELSGGHASAAGAAQAEHNRQQDDPACAATDEIARQRRRSWQAGRVRAWCVSVTRRQRPTPDPTTTGGGATPTAGDRRDHDGAAPTADGRGRTVLVGASAGTFYFNMRLALLSRRRPKTVASAGARVAAVDILAQKRPKRQHVAPRFNRSRGVAKFFGQIVGRHVSL